MDQVTHPRTADDGWRLLYLVGAAAAVVAVLFFRRNCGAELTAFNGLGIWDVPAIPPVRADGWFALFQKDTSVGLPCLASSTWSTTRWRA